MTLTKSTRMLVGFATLWVVIYPLIFMCVWLVSFVGIGAPIVISETTGSDPSAAPLLLFPLFAVIFPVHLCTMILIVGLEIFYLIHVIKNETANETVKIILGVGTFLMPFIAMPVYYYAYIWNETPPDWAIKKV